MTDSLLTVRSGKTIDPDAEYMPITAAIIDVEKRRGTSKYYVYTIEVATQGNHKYCIYRRYAQFHEMHTALMENCSPELSKKIPLLPPKIYFGRSAVREVANERMPLLNDFIKRLMQMPEVMKKECLRDFFTQSIGDGKPYEYQNPILKSPLPPRKGSHDKSKPSSPILKLTPRNNPNLATPKKGPRVLVLFEYFARDQDELTLIVGKTVTLTRQLDTNWLEGEYLGKHGIFPSSYVRIIEPLQKCMDEFDFSDEWDDEEEETFFTAFYKGVPRQIEIDSEKALNPTYQELMNAIRIRLKVTDIVLNFRDKDDDLIAILDDCDVRIMLSESFYPGGSKRFNCTNWAVYVTKVGDYSGYNTEPYQRVI